ncbi:NAD(P)/FAD-dependent oxidoreductase [Mucilaginibacter sp. CAU 1740]|uniref:FAD-dependent oxidoreductase n=1 Tax=Mucilaginibacter sp. CAU 1740 TaxID=3140365 RepID=UPI00325AF3B7
MTLQKKQIAIIGGGPGGLTLARLLQLKGAQVKVYERDLHQTARIQGGALDLHTESGLAALAKAGLMEEFKAHYRPGAELCRVTDQQLNILLDEHPLGRKSDFGDKNHRPEIDRGPLRDLLLNSLAPGTVVWDSQVTRMELLGDQWQIHFANGNSVTADIIVGADGSNSKIRSYVTDIKPIWTGITLLEGAIKESSITAPHIHQLLKDGKIFSFGNDQAIFVSSKGDGSFGFAASFRSDENWAKDSGIDFKDHRQVLEWFKNEYNTWSPVWWELFYSPDTIFIPRPQYCMPLKLCWKSHSNITLLGDAAHWMPPFAGEGVNMAMLDALQLSEAFCNPKFNDTCAAIAHYEKQLFTRFAKVGQETLFNTRWMHGSKALQFILAMFGSNSWKKTSFLARYILQVNILPALRRLFSLPPDQSSVNFPGRSRQN